MKCKPRCLFSVIKTTLNPYKRAQVALEAETDMIQQQPFALGGPSNPFCLVGDLQIHLQSF